MILPLRKLPTGQALIDLGKTLGVSEHALYSGTGPLGGLDEPELQRRVPEAHARPA